MKGLLAVDSSVEHDRHYPAVREAAAADPDRELVTSAVLGEGSGREVPWCGLSRHRAAFAEPTVAGGPAGSTCVVATIQHVPLMFSHVGCADAVAHQPPSSRSQDCRSDDARSVQAPRYSAGRTVAIRQERRCRSWLVEGHRTTPRVHSPGRARNRDLCCQRAIYVLGIGMQFAAGSRLCGRGQRSRGCPSAAGIDAPSTPCERENMVQARNGSHRGNTRLDDRLRPVGHRRICRYGKAVAVADRAASSHDSRAYDH